MGSERLMQVVAELRRRSVGRVAVAYAVVAWLIVEVANTVFPRLLLPEWSVTAVIVAAIVGFPVAVALAWSFELAPDPASAGTLRRMRPWLGALMAAVLLLLGAALSARWLPRVISSQQPIDAIVVLPFENLSRDTADDYFVAGMFDALVGELSQVTALRVISRRSAIRYAGSTKSVAEIARELNVNGVIDGSVERTQTAVRVRVSLITPRPEERQLWSQAFTSELRDVRTMHGDIARNIAQQIRVSITPEQEARLSAARPTDPATYEAYLRGMYHLQQAPELGRQRGLQYLHEAVDLDPANAAAYAGLAYGYVTIGHGPAPTPDVWQRARAAATRAITLDPHNAEARASLADVKLYHEWDWAGAEREFRHVNQLNPNIARNHYHYAWYLVLMNRMEEAIAEHKLAQALDPFTPVNTAHLAVIYSMIGRHDDAFREIQKAVEIRPDGPAVLSTLGDLYLSRGMTEQAIATHERLAQLTSSGRWTLGLTYATTGRVEQARRIASELEREPSAWNAIGLAAIYGQLGEYDRAFRWLNYEPAHAWLPWIRMTNWRVASWLEPLQDDPRYLELLQKFGLPPLPQRAAARTGNRAS